MDKKNNYKLCFTFAVLFTAIFIVQLVSDYAAYCSTLNSAPFYVWAIADGVYFLLPAAAFLTAGLILRKKFRNG